MEKGSPIEISNRKSCHLCHSNKGSNLYQQWTIDLLSTVEKDFLSTMKKGFSMDSGRSISHRHQQRFLLSIMEWGSSCGMDIVSIDNRQLICYQQWKMIFLSATKGESSINRNFFYQE